MSACSSPAEASDLPTPDVVWVSGEPTGPGWDSEWAGAYLEASIQRTAARAYGDFSDPDLVAAMGYDSALDEARTVEDLRFDPESDLRPFVERDGIYAFWGAITRVDVASDSNSAFLYTCYATVHTGFSELIPIPTSYEITRQADGQYSVDRRSQAEDPTYDQAEACSDPAIWVAKWAEPIDIDNVGRDSVRMPLPRDYYVKLGVISE